MIDMGVINVIKRLWDTFLNSSSRVDPDSLEAAIVKYNIPEDAAKVLLESARKIEEQKIAEETEKRNIRKEIKAKGNKEVFKGRIKEENVRDDDERERQ